MLCIWIASPTWEMNSKSQTSCFITIECFKLDRWKYLKCLENLVFCTCFVSLYFCVPKLQHFLSFKCIWIQAKQMMSLLFLDRFYPAMSYRCVQREKKAANCCARFGHSLRSAISRQRKGLKSPNVFQIQSLKISKYLEYPTIQNI